jgi:hypothetical protein
MLDRLGTGKSKKKEISSKSKSIMLDRLGIGKSKKKDISSKSKGIMRTMNAIDMEAPSHILDLVEGNFIAKKDPSNINSYSSLHFQLTFSASIA